MIRVDEKKKYEKLFQKKFDKNVVFIEEISSELNNSNKQSINIANYYSLQGEKLNIDEIDKENTLFVVLKSRRMNLWRTNNYLDTTNKTDTLLLEKGFYLEYDEEFDVIVLKFLIFELSETTKTFSLKEEVSVVIDKNYAVYVPTLLDIKIFEYYFKSFSAEVFNTIDNEKYIYRYNLKKYYKIIRDYFGDMILDNEDVDYYPYYVLPKMFYYFYSENDIQVDSKILEEINPLSQLSTELKEQMLICVKNCGYFSLNIENYNQFISTNNVLADFSYGFIEKISDDTSVIRVYSVFYDLGLFEKEVFNIDDFVFFEKIRIYVSNNDACVYKRNFDKWVSVPSEELDLRHVAICLVGNISDNLIENCNLKFFKDSLIELINIASKDLSINEYRLYRRKTQKVFLTILFPFFESFMNEGYEDLADIFLQINASGTSLKHAFKNFWGSIDYSQKSFYKAVGLNKRIVEKIYNLERFFSDDNSMFWGECMINRFKNIFEQDFDYFINLNSNDLNSCINNVFSLIKKTPVDCVENIIHAFFVLYGRDNFINFLSWLVDFFEYLHDYLDYSDYLNMSLDMQDEIGKIPYKFTSAEEFNTAHNNISFIYNNFHDEALYSEYNKKIDDLKVCWKQYEYTNGVFSVLYPENAQEILYEGITLHHCVKSFISTVTKGETIILFIRKSDDLKKPFFTLEIRNNKVRQCRGYSNCSIFIEEGLEAFLKEFCKIKNITYLAGNMNDMLGI